MKQKLLVLDDELLILTSLEHLFEDEYEVFTSTDAEMALALALANDLAVILCDERMPGVSGHVFLRRVREVSRATRVMISGYADMDALTEAVNSGQIFAYVSKPWDPRALRATVSAAVVQFKLVQEIDQEREWLRALMENIPDLIYFKDCQSRFTRVNQAHARNLGAKDSAECIGKSNADYFGSEDAFRWRREEEEIVSSAQSQADRIERVRPPGGALRWWSTTKVPMFDRSGQVSGIAGISRDITALKEGEDLLREQNERNRMILETANDAFIGMEPDGTITAWNPRAEQTFGWAASEVLGCRWYDVMIAPAGRAAHANGMQDFLSAAQPPRANRAMELMALHRDGREFPVEATVWPVQMAGACSFNAFLRDISERRRAEDDLWCAKASAESANRAKSEFLTTVSHEMRTPMNAILGMADLLSESSLGEEQREYVGVFQKAGANLLDLINDILDLSKVESGHVELEAIGFNLETLLRKIIEMLDARARDRGLHLILEILPTVPLGLVGDPNRLRQVLVNLVGNALKFTERGSITLRVEPDSECISGGSISGGLIRGGGAPGCLRFVVEDTGIGIAADKVEVIFNRFTQADSSITRKYGGTGLGLAISKGLVQLMGGRIGCSSEEGRGSAFFVTVPFRIHEEMEAPQAAQPSAIAIPPAGREGQKPVFRILIVEDSEDNVLLVKAYLKSGGFDLDFAQNGKIAVEKVTSGPPHLVLMDLQMPVMGGLEATRIIREWEAKTGARPIPILALTAHAAAEGAARSLAAGCNEHLTKPIKKSTLLEAVSRHLGGKIRVTPPQGIEGLVPKYLQNVRLGINEILAGGESKDCERARRLGHQFKGSGVGYGFPEITRAGAAVELAAKASDRDEIRSQILALSSYLDRVEIAV